MKPWLFLCRLLRVVPLSEYRRVVRERDDAAALAKARYDDLYRLWDITTRKAKTVQADLDAMRAAAVKIEDSGIINLASEAREIRKLIHDVRGHL